jgi:hypothetical protein
MVLSMMSVLFIFYTFIKKMLISKVTLQNQHLYFVLMVISKTFIILPSKTYNLAGSTHLKI